MNINNDTKNNETVDLAKGKNVETIKIGDTTFYLPYSGLFPRLSDSKFEGMCDSVAVVGIQIPIVVDEHFNVIDGEHRLRAAVKMGIKFIQIDIRPGLTEEEKLQLMLDLNLHRRHLSPSQLEQLIINLRAKGKSLRQIAEKLNISHTTVNRKLSDATGTLNTVEFPDTIIGKDNKKRAAKAKPKKKPRIIVNSLKELNRAVDACNLAGSENLPNKPITLKRLERIAREEENERLRKREYIDFKRGAVELLSGDFRQKGFEIPDNSADVVFTDPLYAKEFLPVWSDLSEFAARILKPGGLLLAYSGILYLPQVHQMLGEHLTYHWTAAIYHSGGKKLVRSAQVHQAWKPVLIYSKPPLRSWAPFVDMVSGGQSKDNHEYEQSVDEALHYIRALCPKNGILIDPMMGSGTTIIAGLQSNLGLKCIGIEIDKAAFATAQDRIVLTMEKTENDAA